MQKALMMLWFVIAPLAMAQTSGIYCTTPPAAGARLLSATCGAYALTDKDEQCGHFDTPPPTDQSFGGPGSPGPIEEYQDDFPLYGVVAAPGYGSVYTSGQRFLPGAFPGTTCESALTLNTYARDCACLWDLSESQPSGGWWIEREVDVVRDIFAHGYCNYPACLTGGAPEPQ